MSHAGSEMARLAKPPKPRTEGDRPVPPARGPLRRSDPPHAGVATAAVEKNLTDLVERAAPAEQPALASESKEGMVVAAARAYVQCARPAPAVAHDPMPTSREQAG
jgi:hypothetical protein